MTGYHEPVLLKEILDRVRVEKGAWYIDCTLGDGGYSLGILRLGGNIIGIDVDPEALARTKDRFGSEGIGEDRFRLVKGNFRDINILVQAEKLKVKGIIFDLGVSSLQLKTPSRGFSFLLQGDLDMRMDPNLGVKAADLINAGEKEELNELFTKFGEEKFAFRFAKAIVSSRSLGPISSTKQLAEILEKAAWKRGRIHPATKVFQALRIAVNDELAALDEALPKAFKILCQDGVLVVVSFHSLEDRIVKNNFKQFSLDDKGKIITKKPITPSDMEVLNNPAARSGKLRIFQKNVSN